MPAPSNQHYHSTSTVRTPRAMVSSLRRSVPSPQDDASSEPAIRHPSRPPIPPQRAADYQSRQRAHDDYCPQCRTDGRCEEQNTRSVQQAYAGVDVSSQIKFRTGSDGWAHRTARIPIVRKTSDSGYQAPRERCSGSSQGSLPVVSVDAESAQERKRTCVTPRWRVSRPCEVEVEGRRLGTLSWRVFDAVRCGVVYGPGRR